MTDVESGHNPMLLCEQFLTHDFTVFNSVTLTFVKDKLGNWNNWLSSYQFEGWNKLWNKRHITTEPFWIRLGQKKTFAPSISLVSNKLYGLGLGLIEESSTLFLWPWWGGRICDRIWFFFLFKQVGHVFLWRHVEVIGTGSEKTRVFSGEKMHKYSKAKEDTRPNFTLITPSDKLL